MFYRDYLLNNIYLAVKLLASSVLFFAVDVFFAFLDHLNVLGVVGLHELIEADESGIFRLATHLVEFFAQDIFVSIDCFENFILFIA